MHKLPTWLLNAWRLAKAAGSSDLHLLSSQKPRWRIHGQLCIAHDLPPCPPAPWPDISPTAMGHALEHDGAWSEPELGRVRWNLSANESGLLLCLRLINEHIPSATALQITQPQLALMQHKQGLVLVTGATGSGKSSTLAALVQHWRSQHQGHVLTLEDPIEFCYPSADDLVSQRAIGRDSHCFADALRAGLRQDPDLILIGELRDLETARLALTAAETGHLVLTTLHTRTAISAIDRLLCLFPGNEQAQARMQLADSLIAVLAQELIWRQGQAAACREVLINTPAVRHLIRDQQINQIHSLMQTGQSLGMQTRDQAYARLSLCTDGL
ncbi:MAG: PilT/PilU family type 4a pilus ATPase [Moraxellaceae bacterium]|nr:PilT/PilU family type 4a pilus ATPase [Moraxellaceae bacterium]MDZ4386363.1 PilT/PilU family type 4a pilus ATPase [Moraxellaceae bacterium]